MDFFLLAFRILQPSFFLLGLISSHLLCTDRWPTLQSFFFFFSTLKQTDFKLFNVTLVSFYLFFCFVRKWFLADNRYRGANVISMLSNQDIATLLLVGRSSVICLILHMNDKTRSWMQTKGDAFKIQFQLPIVNRIMPAAHNRTCCVNISLASRTGQLSRKYRDERWQTTLTRPITYIMHVTRFTVLHCSRHSLLCPL